MIDFLEKAHVGFIKDLYTWYIEYKLPQSIASQWVTCPFFSFELSTFVV